ncbi:MAG: aminopeptidase P family protein [Alphaproteobacteria bacterium]|nr:aminopeptidase P family protein [Alphaproteobacteria bacterium]
MTEACETPAPWQEDPAHIGFVRRCLGRTLKDHEPTPDMARLTRYRYRRLQDQIIRADCAGALLFGSVNLRYATGTRYAQISNMHSPVRAVYVPAEGGAVLYDWEMYAFGTKPEFVGEYRDPPVTAYFLAGDSYQDQSRKWAGEIAALVRAWGSGSRRLALDIAEPELVVALIGHGIEIVNAEKLVDRAAAIKSEDELFCLAVTVSIAEGGLARLRESLRAGMTEQELWAEFTHACIAQGAEWFDYSALASGGRTNPWGQECGDKVIRAGELVGIDTGMIGPFGYGADVSRTFFCPPGRPSAEQRRLYRAALENLAHNINLIRAGMSFREYTEKSWPVPEEFWARRYNAVAHGVGMGNEWPHIPFARDWPAHVEKDGVFEENMVIAIESCIGRADGVECVKLEEMVVVKHGPCHVLSTFPFEDDMLH